MFSVNYHEHSNNIFQMTVHNLESGVHFDFFWHSSDATKKDMFRFVKHTGEGALVDTFTGTPAVLAFLRLKERLNQETSEVQTNKHIDDAWKELVKVHTTAQAEAETHRQKFEGTGA